LISDSTEDDFFYIGTDDSSYPWLVEINDEWEILDNGVLPTPNIEQYFPTTSTPTPTLTQTPTPTITVTPTITPTITPTSTGFTGNWDDSKFWDDNLVWNE
jgi:hypothetical protein